MEWSLPFDWKPPVTGIQYTDSLLFLGSCFAENIGKKFQTCRFKADVNPFGIMYNPLSIANVISYLDRKKILSYTSLFYANELWAGYDFHSSFSDTDKQRLMERLQNTLIAAQHHWNSTKWVFITLGTAKVFRSNETEEVVANCHKLEAKQFSPYYLKVNEIVQSWSSIIEAHPNKQFFFSLSPVRYVREGLIASNNGKAVLRQAIVELEEKYSNVHYLPSYEWIVDVLRDYRFYAIDKVHPSEEAIDFVFSQTKECLLDTISKVYVKEWEFVEQMLSHRLLFPKTKQAIEFEVKRKKALLNFEQKWHHK